MASTQYKNMRYRISTVAVYGNSAPVIFDGHLVMKEFYHDNTNEPDKQKSAEYLRENLFYEVNKVLREKRHEDYGEDLDLYTMRYVMLSDPYRIVYNLRAAPGRDSDNLIEMLRMKDPYARGTAIVMKETEDGTLTWLSYDEAVNVKKKLAAI